MDCAFPGENEFVYLIGETGDSRRRDMLNWKTSQWEYVPSWPLHSHRFRLD